MIAPGDGQSGGQPADMDPIIEVARARDLYVIEDAAQAHGAEYKGRRAGSLGDAGCFSFYPGKNLGAFGEAGAVVTDSNELQEKIRICRTDSETGTCSTRCSRRIATFCCGVKCLRVFSMGILSDAPHGPGISNSV